MCPCSKAVLAKHEKYLYLFNVLVKHWIIKMHRLHLKDGLGTSWLVKTYQALILLTKIY